MNEQIILFFEFHMKDYLVVYLINVKILIFRPNACNYLSNQHYLSHIIVHKLINFQICLFHHLGIGLKSY